MNDGAAKAWTDVTNVDELWEGEVGEFSVDGRPVLVAHLRSGEIKAFQGTCPHAGFPLADGQVEDGVLVCSAHSWEFDLATGLGVNPESCKLQAYPVRRDGDRILVALTEEGARR